jgi:OFA family oxalate/formate antiporter-like MFS transporter
MRKWVVLAAGVVSQTALGGLYAWSTFVPHLMSTYGLSRAQCGLIFGVMIAVFTLATIPAGRFLLKYGPRLTAGTGALLFICGYLLASFSQGSYALIITGLGVVAGTGIGFGYVCPLSVGMKWFPESKGMVTGVAVAGFGLGAILLSSIANMLLESMDVLVVFRIAGISLGGMAFAAAMFLTHPPSSRAESGSDRREGSVRSHLISTRFLLIWFGMFSGTFAGLLVSGNLKPMKLSLGLDEHHAALAIPLFAVGNTLGRLIWGQIHDRLGPRKTILLSLGALLFSVLPLLFLAHAAAILAFSVLIGFGFGACFVVYASSVVDFFGDKYLPHLYPVVFAGYGLAALLGPPAGGWIADTFGSYSGALLLSAGVLLAAFLAIYVKLPSFHRPQSNNPAWE